MDGPFAPKLSPTVLSDLFRASVVLRAEVGRPYKSAGLELLCGRVALFQSHHPPHEKSTPEGCFFHGVDDGTRTHGLQSHNLTP